jgi:hypothetical protein
LGASPLYTNQGVGASPGYTFLDIRRYCGAGLNEGPYAEGAFAVTQRAAGANMSVDIAANVHDNGLAAIVQGDAVTGQGPYGIPPHSAPINEVVAAAHATLPRIDTVMLELFDNQHDAFGQNLARVRVVAGTATAGATLDNRLGAPSLSTSAMPVADILVDAAATTITTAKVRDTRPKRRGKCIIATEETRTNTAYGLLTTEDVVRGIVLPADGLIRVGYQAEWKESVAGAASAELFIGANGIKGGFAGLASPSAIPASINSANNYVVLSSHAYGIASLNGALLTGAYTGDVTTGQVVAGARPNPTVSAAFFGGGECVIFAAAGTYDVSVQFKASSGSVTAKARKLWVESVDYGRCV